MTDAMYQLEASSKSFNTAAGKVTTLNSVLKEDFLKGNSYFDSAVNKVCKDKKPMLVRQRVPLLPSRTQLPRVLLKAN